MKGDNRGDMQLTVKLPIEKAKEIESLRAGNSTMIRVYGHVIGKNADQAPLLRKDGSEAGLSKVKHWNLYSQGRRIQNIFFLDSDQLKRSKS
jgi:hypothetical protein